MWIPCKEQRGANGPQLSPASCRAANRMSLPLLLCACSGGQGGGLRGRHPAPGEAVGQASRGQHRQRGPGGRQGAAGSRGAGGEWLLGGQPAGGWQAQPPPPLLAVQPHCPVLCCNTSDPTQSILLLCPPCPLPACRTTHWSMSPARCSPAGLHRQFSPSASSWPWHTWQRWRRAGPSI